jgi:hypothetical protein
MFGATSIIAGTVSCSLIPLSGPQISETCGQYLFTPNDYLDWGQAIAVTGYSGFGAASSGPFSGPATATSADGIGISLSSSTDQLQRFDNTDYAWLPLLSSWQSPTTVETFTGHAGTMINSFAGHFGAPSGPTSVPPFGDNLLGLVGGTGSSTLTLSFDTAVSGVGFEVSSGENTDFVATLQAFDGLGNSLGIYQVSAAGLGGTCVGLQTLSPETGNPVPCNDAPLIQFAPSKGQQISSVILSVNDGTALIDQLQLQANVPEPSTGLILGIGIVSLLGLRKKSAS